ncbi:uncharacterized protein LOC133828749 [Humulus lupulus]|uniref:uncharacterized protein LOC133828749 n=1 Tax=Humulus lupulus TaxID=3486 RepID=UPI002B408F98|nr:uncharacterized protein LOC133828749 [Humulus lupulus]
MSQPQVYQEKTNELQAALLTLTNTQTQFMTETRASIKNMESQVGQLASMLNNIPQGNFPSTVLNPMEQCNAISLRSGRELEKLAKMTIRLQKVVDEKKDKVEEEANESLDKKQSPVSFKHHIKIPYPQRLEKKMLDKQFSKFLDVFSKLHINIPFAEAFEQMLSYVKFMKEILS